MSKKLIVFALAAVFAVSMTGPAQATTVADLQALIASLNQQIAALQAQITSLTGGQTTPATTGLCITAGLKKGMTSDAVKTLQEGLKQDPSVYPEGLVTGYFGPLTKAAVARFQEKYASEVLAPWGLTKGTGYVGSTTAAKFNALYCTPVTPTTTSTTVAPEETTTTTTVAPAEGILSVSSAPVYKESTLNWGDANKVVYAFKVKAKNSDITLKRITIKITGSNELPWKTFSHIALNNDSGTIKDVEAIKDNFVENDFGSDYDLYFDGLNVLVNEGAEKTFMVTATVQDNPETTGNYTIQLKDNGIRGVDTAGLNQYNSSPVDAYTFTVADSRENKGALEIKNNPSPIEEGIILGKTDSVVHNQPIFKFDVKDTHKDVTLKTVKIGFGSSNGTSTVSAVELYDGDDLLGSTSISGATSTFSDLALKITKDATKTLTVKVDLGKISSSEEGKLLTPSVSATGWSAIDSDDDIADISGSVIGKTQHIYTVAPELSLISVNGQKTNPDTGASTYDATIKFSVTAKEGDIYVNSENNGALGIHGNPEGASNTSDYTYSSTADENTGSNYYTIHSGDTEDFTVSCHLVGNDDYADFLIDHIYWTASSTKAGTAIAGQNDLGWGLDNYKTDKVYLEAN